MPLNRQTWKHRAIRYVNGGMSQTLFIGTQAGCSQAFKDCGVAGPERWVTGLDKPQYQLASSGRVTGKPKADLLRRRGRLIVG